MYDLPSVFSENTRKARRGHKCCECRRVIKTGEEYRLFKGCWEGKWAEYKMCLDCDELRHELQDGEGGPPFGDLAEWAFEAGVEFPIKEATR